jgi:hypothetical protein
MVCNAVSVVTVCVDEVRGCVCVCVCVPFKFTSTLLVSIIGYYYACVVAVRGGRVYCLFCKCIVVSHKLLNP